MKTFTLLALIASLIARVETNFAILTTIIRHLKRRLKMPCLGPVHTYLVKTQLFKNALQSGDFWKRRLLIFVWMDQNGGFRIRWCHISYILLTLCKFRKRWYAFSFGRAKTIRIRGGVFVWMDSPNRIHHTEFVLTQIWSMQYMSLSGFVWTWPECLFLFNWLSLLTRWHQERIKGTEEASLIHTLFYR